MSKYAHLSHAELVRLLEARDRRDATRFGLVWEASEIERDKALNSDFVALDLDPSLCAGAAPWENLIIEGDNFDALRHLRMCYAGRVKCIYIDPPYNTGNRDFVYNDRFVDINDAWRHSTWVEFMYQRLTLAKDLLRQDGVIFVSIDDNEVFALGMLMNRIFGEGNFVANVIWQKNFSPKNTAKHFSADHDFIVAYALSGESWKPNPLPRTEEQDKAYKNPDNDPRGLWSSSDIQARNPYSLGIYPITCPSGRVIPGPGKGSYWRVSFEKFKELDADKRIWWGKDGNGMPRIKRFLSEVKEGRVPQTLWPYSEVGHTQDAKKELLKILPDADVVFSTPKPVALIERILRIATNPGDLILDFFAGSGTTAHAVLKLNAEAKGDEACSSETPSLECGGRGSEATGDTALGDLQVETAPESGVAASLCRRTPKKSSLLDGCGFGETALPGDSSKHPNVCAPRRFILVSNTEATEDEPGKNLCRDVCARRVRRVIEGYGGTPGLGGNFAYLRTRRIAPGSLVEIDHAQVWSALQLLHTGTLAPFDASRDFLMAGDGREALVYVPRFSKKILPALRAAVRGADAVTIYSWQPDLLRRGVRSKRAHHEPIPESLARKFGLRKEGAP